MGMDKSIFEITDRGTDREALTYHGLRYWLDTTSDPQNSIGWLVEDENGSQEMCSVNEPAAVPGARDYVIERTRDGLTRAEAVAKENGWANEPVATLRLELAVAVQSR